MSRALMGTTVRASHECGHSCHAYLCQAGTSDTARGNPAHSCWTCMSSLKGTLFFTLAHQYKLSLTCWVNFQMFNLCSTDHVVHKSKPHQMLHPCHNQATQTQNGQYHDKHEAPLLARSLLEPLMHSTCTTHMRSTHQQINAQSNMRGNQELISCFRTDSFSVCPFTSF